MFIAIHDVALRHVPINNWAIINLVLIIAHTISYESQHLYLKNQKKRKPILHELLTYHQTLNLMTLIKNCSFSICTLFFIDWKNK